MGGKYHRMYTLGHDPILGWFFGTANILTDCITFHNFNTNRISFQLTDVEYDENSQFINYHYEVEI